VVRGAGARAVPDAKDLADAAGEGGDDGVGAVDGDLLAGAHGGHRGRRVAAPAVGGAVAALHLGGAGAQAGGGGAGAVGAPAAERLGAAAQARRLGAAQHVGGVGGAGARDGRAAAGRAVRLGDADAGGARGAVAGLVDGGQRHAG
jgi:hypothetical protein